MENLRSSFISRHVAVAILFIIVSSVLSLKVQAENRLVPGVFGDPHFTGWDGVHFDFTGEPDSVYCMISDPTLHINMKLEGTKETVPQRTWIKSLGILFWTHRIILTAAKGSDLTHNGFSFLHTIEVDGEVIHLKEGENYRSSDGQIVISYDHYRSHKLLPSDHYTIYLRDIAEVRVSAGPEIPDLRTEAEAFIHLSVEMEDAVLSSKVHGVLGQTYLNAKGRLHGNSYRTRWNDLLLAQQVDGSNGDGYLDGSVSDYISSGLLYSDCHFSRFDANFDPSNEVLVKVSSGYSRKFLPHWESIGQRN
eukprot:Gb_08582 [translate_table: standard]